MPPCCALLPLVVLAAASPPAGGAPPPPRPPPQGAATPASGPSTDRAATERNARRAARNAKKRKLPHDGFTVDFRVGMLGCLKAVCAGRHDADMPGIRLDGFFGGNVRGFVDFGVAGGWGRMHPEIPAGTNVFQLYGIDVATLEAVLPWGIEDWIGLDSFVATAARLQAAQGGPVIRIHLVPWGRALAYVGSGGQYNLFRADYQTRAGAVRVDLHGVAVPLEIGLGVHVHRNVALVAHFDWRWTWYGLAVIDNPTQRLTLPMSYLVQTARVLGVDLRDELPQFWTLGLALRARV